MESREREVAQQLSPGAGWALAGVLEVLEEGACPVRVAGVVIPGEAEALALYRRLRQGFGEDEVLAAEQRRFEREGAVGCR